MGKKIALILAVSGQVLRAFALEIYFQQSDWYVVVQLPHFMKWAKLTLKNAFKAHYLENYATAPFQYTGTVQVHHWFTCLKKLHVLYDSFLPLQGVVVLLQFLSIFRVT